MQNILDSLNTLKPGISAVVWTDTQNTDRELPNNCVVIERTAEKLVYVAYDEAEDFRPTKSEIEAVLEESEE